MNSLWFSNVLLIGLTAWAMIHVVVILIFGEYTVKEPRKYIAIFEVFFLLAIMIFAFYQLK